MINYSDKELESMLNDIESDLVERKQQFTGEARDKARQAVCAFANDLPAHDQAGILFIGVRDDGVPAEIAVNDQLLRELADIKTDGRILPTPVVLVEKRILKGQAVAVVAVQPADMTPVKYDGRIWIRVGSRRALANAQEERILIEKRRYKNTSFDICAVPGAHITDFSKTIFENDYLPAAFAVDVLEANNRSYEERLAACKMIVAPAEPVPTILGLLTIGKSPLDFLPGAYIQFLRISGQDLADPVVDEDNISGTFIGMLGQVLEKLNAHNRIAVDIVSEPTHKKEWIYPPAAIQQILYNAILHRTYENTNAPIRVYWFNDRLEIHSPGGPYGNVTAENFGKPGITDYRNPNIAAVLKDFGFIQAFGRGIATARRELEKNGNPPLEFEVSQSAVVCILRNKQ